MAWTAPRTWVTDELVTAALMNTHVRDNFNSTMHVQVRKTADQSVISTTTLTNESSLLLAVAASEVWQFTFTILYQSSTTADFNVAFTFPSGGTITAAGLGLVGGSAFLGRFEGSTTPTAAISFDGTATPTVSVCLVINGVFVNSSTAGNLQLQFAQINSHAVNTTIKANSTLMAVKLA